MSSIVVGAGTTVSFGGRSDICVISVNWGFNPNVQRLYCLGSWSPYMTIYKPTETLNITLYASGPVSYNTGATENCATPDGVSASVSARTCGDILAAGMSGTWLVTGYQYSKEDGVMPGQESWALTRWTGLNATIPSDGLYREPSFIMRGISEGEASDQSITGIRFTGNTAISYTGSVSAGSFGTADRMYSGTVASVGGGSSSEGDTGQGSASIPYTPFYIS